MFDNLQEISSSFIDFLWTKILQRFQQRHKPCTLTILWRSSRLTKILGNIREGFSTGVFSCYGRPNLTGLGGQLSHFLEFERIELSNLTRVSEVPLNLASSDLEELQKKTWFLKTSGSGAGYHWSCKSRSGENGCPLQVWTNFSSNPDVVSRIDPVFMLLTSICSRSNFNMVDKISSFVNSGFFHGALSLKFVFTRFSQTQRR